MNWKGDPKWGPGKSGRNLKMINLESQYTCMKYSVHEKE